MYIYIRINKNTHMTMCRGRGLRTRVAGKLKYHSYVITVCGLCCFVCILHYYYIYYMGTLYYIQLPVGILRNFHGQSLFRNYIRDRNYGKECNGLQFFCACIYIYIIYHGPVHTLGARWHAPRPNRTNKTLTRCWCCDVLQCYIILKKQSLFFFFF